jgi:hypothetical protein
MLGNQILHVIHSAVVNGCLAGMAAGAKFGPVGHHLMHIRRQDHSGATAVGSRDLLSKAPAAKPLAPAFNCAWICFNVAMLLEKTAWCCRMRRIHRTVSAMKWEGIEGTRRVVNRIRARLQTESEFSGNRRNRCLLHVGKRLRRSQECRLACLIPTTTISSPRYWLA